MRALVTGATGFIGSHLVDALLDRGDEVHVLVRDPRRLTWVDPARLTVHEGDLTRPDSVRRAAEGADCVFHLAAALRARTSAEYEAVNRQGTRAVVEAVRGAAGSGGGDGPRLVYCSSLAAGGPSYDGRPVSAEDPPRPVSEYGRTKLAGETIIREEIGHIPWVVLRPPPVYGPRDKDIFKAIRVVKAGLKPVFGSGRQLLPMIHVHDLARALVLAGASNVTGRIYYVTDGDLRTIAGVFDAMARAAGARPLTIPIPLWAFSLAGSLGQLWSDMTGRPVLINRDKARELRAPHWCCDDGPMRRELGFAPRYGLDEGMADAVRWYRENRWL